MLEHKNRKDIEGKGKEFECEWMLSTNASTSAADKAAGAWCLNCLVSGLEAEESVGQTASEKNVGVAGDEDAAADVGVDEGDVGPIYPS